MLSSSLRIRSKVFLVGGAGIDCRVHMWFGIVGIKKENVFIVLGIPGGVGLFYVGRREKAELKTRPRLFFFSGGILVFEDETNWTE